MAFRHYKPENQRSILRAVATLLEDVALNWTEEDVETLLDHLESGVLTPLSRRNFFGSQDIEYVLGLK